MKKLSLLCLLLFFITILSAQNQKEIIIQLYPNENIKTFQTTFPNFNFQQTLITDLNIHLFSISQKKQYPIAYLQANNIIKNAIWNENIESRNIEPNDSKYQEQWALKRIGMPKFWDISTGGESANGDEIVVAIIDKDFSTMHEDLSKNAWINLHEIPDNGIDDDGNNYIDDVHGWNFKNGTGQPEERSSGRSHGVPISGIIGGTGNNGVGISGINWNIKMMYLQYDEGTFAELFLAYEYLTEMRRRYNESGGEKGAFVVVLNTSFGLSTQSVCENSNMWNEVHNMMGKVGVLIAASTNNSPFNVDEVGDIPSACPSDYIISVTSTDTLDQRWQGSAFGKIGVDLGAPGIRILSTSAGDTYNNSFNGNSAAAPHVAGAIAMLYSLPCQELADQAISHPAETAILVKRAILDGVDPLESLANLTATGGRLNVFNAALELESFCDPNPITVNQLTIKTLYPNPARGNLTVQYETSELTFFTIRIFDAIGRLVEERKGNSCCTRTNQETFDLSTYASGIYFLQIENGGESNVQSFSVN